MRRRGFLGTAIGIIAGLVCGGPEAPRPLRAVHRWDGGGWVRCRMFDLRQGDVFWLEDVGVFRAAVDPTRQPDGVWGVDADYEIDPATNRWVPSRG